MKTDLNYQDADLFYEQLLDAHSDLTPEQSQDFNARLILLMANQIGDSVTLKALMDAASDRHSRESGNL